MINLKRCFEPQQGPVWPPHPCQRIVLVGEVEDAVGVTATVYSNDKDSLQSIKTI